MRARGGQDGGDQPSAIWGPMTGATLVVAVALDVGGTTLTGRWLNRGGRRRAVDARRARRARRRGRRVAPRIPARGHRGGPATPAAAGREDPLRRASARALRRGESLTGESLTGESPTSSSATPSTLAASRTARVAQLEASDGLGLRVLGVAAARAPTSSDSRKAANLIGVGVSLVPVAGPFIAGPLAAALAAYSP